MAKELCSQTCVFNVLRTILFVLHLSANGVGFNLQATRNDIIYAPNKNVQQKREGMEEPSNFFGYDFALQKDGDTNPPSITLLIGSPKDARESQIPTVRKSPVPETESKTKPGNIFSCQLTLFEDGEKSSSCISVAPEPDRYDVKSLTKEDSLGLSIVKGSPRRGQSTPTHQVLSCAPLRQTNCTTTYLTAGICYSSEDFGRSWEESKQPTRSCPTQKLDMMLVLDGSGSVTNDDPLNFDRVKDWVKKIAQSFDLSEFARMGVVQYSHWYKNRDVQPYIKTEIKLGAFNNPRDLEIALDKVTIQGYTTYTAHAINKTVQDFQESDRFEDPATKKVMVLLTDGRSNDSPQLEYSAAYARSLGITIFAVGVGGYSTKELQLMATGEIGNNKRVYGLRKFSDLQKIVDSLQKSITGILEGGTTVNETNGLQSSETGIGGFIAKNEFLLLGAPGAYDWSGAVTKYDSISDTTADIPTYEDVQGVLPNRTKESYMGYTLTTGFFEGPRAGEFAATGAPRYMLKGAVVVFKPEKDSAKFNQPHRIMANEANSQLGSYFGGSLLSVDINGDDIDDLFIGAPLYSGVTHDEGRVYVYVSKPGGRTLSSWTDSSYEPLVLDGMRLIGGRFGTAIASAGDLNNDKMNDVIIGAPMTEGDRGAIFIYHGKKNGFDTNLKQMILASELTGVNLKYFGQSIQGGVDLDGNLYPDVAVGAPKSDTVVIFRSRAVVEIIATVTFLQSKIDIFNCIDNNYVNCTSVQVCFTAQGRSIESVIGLTYNLTLDSGKQSLGEKRLEFRDALSPTGVTTIRQDLPLKSKTRTCVTRGVNVKANIKDYDTTVNVTVTYDLQASHTDQALSSIRDPTAPNTATDSLVFDKNCGVEGQCQYDLKLSGSLLLPPATLTGGEDLTNGGKILIVSDQTDINRVIVKLNLTNKGQNAFGTQVKVDYTSELSWSRIEKRQGVPATNSCIEALGQPVDMGNGLLRQILQYNYRTSIMQQNSWCYFEISFLTRNLRNNGKLDSLNIDVNAFSSDTTNSSIEVNPSDNSWRQTRLIKYRSDFTVEEQSTDPDIQYNFTNTERNITSVKQIGQNTSDVVINYKIRGTGYSNIPTVTIRLIWPSKTAANYSLLYLHSVACNTKYTTANPEKGDNNLLSCNCEMDKVNIYNLSTDAPNENNTGGARFITEPATVYLDQKEYNCFSQEGNHTCETMTCNINNLGSSTEVNFIALFRLVTSTFNLTNTSNSDTNLISRFEAFETSPIILNKAGKNNSFANPASRVARKYTEPIIVVPVNNIWIYILAAVGGLLLLIAIAAILWKVGFFKSKYADMKKDAQDDMDDAADFPGPNNGGSTADIVDN